MNSLYPVIMVENVEIGREFFKTYFGFEDTFANSWYVSMKHKNGNEIAFIEKNHETIPKKYQSNCKGIIINLEFDDIDCIYRELKNNGSIKIIKDICDEDFGQRHFIIDFMDIMIDIIKVIEAKGDYIKDYV